MQLRQIQGVLSIPGRCSRKLRCCSYLRASHPFEARSEKPPLAPERNIERDALHVMPASDLAPTRASLPPPPPPRLGRFRQLHVMMDGLPLHWPRGTLPSWELSIGNTSGIAYLRG